MILLDIATILCTGLMIGTELTVAVFINPTLLQLGDREQVRVTSLFAALLGRVMPFWYAACLMLLVAEAILRRQEASLMLLITAVGIWVAVIVLTVLFLVPINNRLARTEAVLSPETAQREHKRWDMLHRWRVAALIVAMVCFLDGIL